MIKKGNINRAISSLALIILSLFSSCNSTENEESHTTVESEVILEAAEPSVGIGRPNAEDKQVPLGANSIRIMIDPGHGFVDGGAGEGIWNDGTLEKDITLAISEMLEDELSLLGFETIMTHDGETFPKSSIDDGNQIYNVNERVSWASTQTYDYFISIHVNSYKQNTSTSGLRIYYENDDNWRKTGKGSKEIAQMIADSIDYSMEPTVKTLISDQTVASYAVVRETLEAASLVELGFCTNKTDAANMIDPEWQKDVAEAIADGIYTYFTGKSGVNQ